MDIALVGLSKSGFGGVSEVSLVYPVELVCRGKSHRFHDNADGATVPKTSPGLFHSCVLDCLAERFAADSRQASVRKLA